MDAQHEYGIVELNSSTYDEVQALFFKQYVSREPLLQGLHVTESEMLTIMNRDFPSLLESGVSVGARDLQNGQLIGVMMSKILTPTNPKPFESYSNEGSPLHQYYRILNILVEPVDLFEDPDVSKVLDLDILTVHQDYAGRGIGRWLVQESENRGHLLGCTMAVSQLVNIVAQRIFHQLNYTTRVTLDLTKSEMKGQPQLDLLVMNGTTKFTTVTKNLIK